MFTSRNKILVVGYIRDVRGGELRDFRRGIRGHNQSIESNQIKQTGDIIIKL